MSAPSIGHGKGFVAILREYRVVRSVFIKLCIAFALEMKVPQHNMAEVWFIEDNTEYL